jgi:hypothetical protein
LSVQEKIIHFFENILSFVANVCNALSSVQKAVLRAKSGRVAFSGFGFSKKALLYLYS